VESFRGRDWLQEYQTSTLNPESHAMAAPPFLGATERKNWMLVTDAGGRGFLRGPEPEPGEDSIQGVAGGLESTEETNCTAGLNRD